MIFIRFTFVVDDESLSFDVACADGSTLVFVLGFLLLLPPAPAPPDDDDTCRLTVFFEGVLPLADVLLVAEAKQRSLSTVLCDSSADMIEPVLALLAEAGRVSFSELELSDDELEDRWAARFVSLSDDDDELLLFARLNQSGEHPLSFFKLLSYLLFSFLLDFFSLPSVLFPRESFEAWLPVLWLLLLPFSAFFNVWLEIWRPGRNLFVVDEGETNFLLPLDFLSLPFFTALEGNID